MIGGEGREHIEVTHLSRFEKIKERDGKEGQECCFAGFFHESNLTGLYGKAICEGLWACERDNFSEGR